MAGLPVIGGRNGGDRCAFPESGRSNRSREFHFQFPNCGIFSASLRVGYRLLLILEEFRLVNGCDRCVPAPASTHSTSDRQRSTCLHIRGPTLSPKVNWETKFVRQCSDVQDPECSDSLVGGLWRAHLPYSPIMRPEKHAIGCTHTHTQHEWPVPQNPPGVLLIPPLVKIFLSGQEICRLVMYSLLFPAGKFNDQ